MIKTALNKYLIIKPYLEQDCSLSSIALNNGVPMRTLQRWVAQYKKAGLQYLDRKVRSDLGKYRKITEQSKKVIEGLFLHKQNISIENITKTVNAYNEEQNIAQPNYLNMLIGMKQVIFMTQILKRFLQIKRH